MNVYDYDNFTWRFLFKIKIVELLLINYWLELEQICVKKTSQLKFPIPLSYLPVLNWLTHIPQCLCFRSGIAQISILQVFLLFIKLLKNLCIKKRWSQEVVIESQLEFVICDDASENQKKSNHILFCNVFALTFNFQC